MRCCTWPEPARPSPSSWAGWRRPSSACSTPRSARPFPAPAGSIPVWRRSWARCSPFPTSCLLAPIVVAGTAFAALGLADYVRVLIPGAPQLAVTFAGLVFAAVIAVLNIRSSALVTGAFLTVEALALTTLTLVALFHPAAPWALSWPTRSCSATAPLWPRPWRPWVSPRSPGSGPPAARAGCSTSPRRCATRAGRSAGSWPGPA